MSSLILPRRVREGRQLVTPRRQLGFIINPYVFGGGGGGDPYFAFRKTVANLDTDLSDPFRTWTANGGAAVSGGWLNLDGSGDYLATPQSTDFDFGAGLFCTEAFIEIAGNPPAEDVIMSKWGAGSQSWFFGINSAGHVVMYVVNGGGFQLYAGTISVGTSPVHVAAYGDGTFIYASVDGVVQNLGGQGTITTISEQVCIGSQSDGSSNQFTGKIRGCRASKGSTGGYGATNFTPPSFPLPTS